MTKAKTFECPRCKRRVESEGATVICTGQNSNIRRACSESGCEAFYDDVTGCPVHGTASQGILLFEEQEHGPTVMKQKRIKVTK